MSNGTKCLVLASLILLLSSLRALHAQAFSLPPPPIRVSYLSAGDSGAPERFLRVEGYDKGGRLLFLAQAVPGSQSAPPAGGTSPGNAGPVPKVSDLVWREFGWDAAGHLVRIATRKSEGAEIESLETIQRDGDGRPRIIAIEAKGKLVWQLFYSYDGSGLAARANLVDASGSPVAHDELILGEGAATGLMLAGKRLGVDGAVLEELGISIDAQGRASRIERKSSAAGNESKTNSPSAELKSAPSVAFPSPDPAKLGGSFSAVSTKPSPGNAKEGSKPSSPADQAEIQAPPLGAFLLPPMPGDPSMHWDRSAAAGPIALPFSAPGANVSGESSGTAADFLYDGKGQLIRARLFDEAGGLLASVEYRWNGRGLLVEELPWSFGIDDPIQAFRAWEYTGFSSGLWIKRRVSRADGAPLPKKDSATTGEKDAATAQVPALFRQFIWRN